MSYITKRIIILCLLLIIVKHGVGQVKITSYKKKVIDTIATESLDKTYHNTLFLNNIKFLGSFSQLRLDSCTFSANSDFSFFDYKGLTDFTSTNFLKENNFFRTSFFKPVSFSFSYFSRLGFFHTANFHMPVYFYKTNFENNATFVNSRFSVVDFSHANFNGYADFQYTTFVYWVSFDSTTFSKIAYFRGAQVGDSAKMSFKKSRLPDTLDFSEMSNIHNEIDLTAANFDTLNKKADRMHFILLYKSDISKFHFDYTHFKLLFVDPKTNISYPQDEIKALYEQVLKNFKDRGQETSYEKLDVEYHDYTWNYENIWWKKQFGKLIKWWWNYGYCKENVFIHSVGFVLFFSLVNFFILNLLQNVYNVSKIPKTRRLKFIDYPVTDLLLRLWYSFAYTSTIFFSLSIKTEEIDFKHVVRSVYILFIYTLGLVCLAYMANFVLQK